MPVAGAAAAGCAFGGGFKALHDRIPDAVGECLAPEQAAPGAGAWQYTTKGLFVWRQSDNLTAFSDGLRSWLVKPEGIEVEEVDNERPPLMTFNTFIGNVHYERLDLRVPGPGPGLTLRLSYNSGLARTHGALGPGWMHTYEAKIVAGDRPGSVVLLRPTGDLTHYDRGDGPVFKAREYNTTVLSTDNAGMYRAEFADGSLWVFDQVGRLWRMADAAGNTAWVLADADGKVREVKDPAGRGSLTFGYDEASGRLRSVSDWFGRSVCYDYDDAGRLWKVVDWQGRPMTYAYDGATQRITQARGSAGQLLVTNTYDGEGRLATQRDTRRVVPGPPTTLTYDRRPDGTQVTTFTMRGLDDTWSGVTEDYYDARGWRERRVTKPSADPATWRVREYPHDERGRPIVEPEEDAPVV